MASKMSIRKAFEAVLAPALAGYAQTVAVNWPDGTTFDRSTALLTAEPSLHMAPDVPRTLGPTPDVSQSGHYQVLLGLKSGQPDDLLDDLLETVIAAFPFSSELTADGARIRISGHLRGGDPVTVEGWSKTTADIQWSIDI